MEGANSAGDVELVATYLRVRNAADAIRFYESAFGAVEEVRLTDHEERIGFAQLRLGDYLVMLADEFPDYGAIGPETLGGTTAAVYVRVPDVDHLAARAEAAGATVLIPPSDQFYGERACRLKDPFGHEWSLGSKIEDVPPEEMQRRFLLFCDQTG